MLQVISIALQSNASGSTDLLGTVEVVISASTLVMTFFLAWYVNKRLKERFYTKELDERRLKELYAPMNMILTASKAALERYPNSSPDEKRLVARLWLDYNSKMKSILVEKSYLFLESSVPIEVSELLLHIDAYPSYYKQFVQGKIPDPFPGAHGFGFPQAVNGYFSSRTDTLRGKLK